MRRPFFEHFIRAVAMLDEDDRCAGLTGGANERNGMVDESVRIGDRATALAVEGAALNVDDEESSGVQVKTRVVVGLMRRRRRVHSGSNGSSQANRTNDPGSGTANAR